MTETDTQADTLSASVLVSSLSSGIVAFDAEGRMRYANPMARQLLGLSSTEQLDGPTLTQRCEPTAGHPLDGAWLCQQDPAQCHTADLTISRPPRQVVMRTTATAHRVEGQVETWVVNLFEVTGEASARRRADQLARILEASPDMVATLDPQGGLIWMNETMRRIVGDVVPGMRLADLYTDEARQTYLTEALPAMMARGIWSGDLELRLGPGRVSQVSLAHTDAGDRIEFYSAVLRISERP